MLESIGRYLEQALYVALSRLYTCNTHAVPCFTTLDKVVNKQTACRFNRIINTMLFPPNIVPTNIMLK